MKTVYEYLDYQLFLRDLYEERKEQSSVFSYRYLELKLGIDAGTLVKILQGKMHLSDKKIATVSKFLEFNSEEADYFHNLVLFCKAKTESETNSFFEKLAKLRGIDMSRVDDRCYAFYTSWYHNAIRSLLAYFPFNGNYRALAQELSPSISVKEAKESIELLSSLGLIAQGSDGYYKQTSKTITTGEKWKSAAIAAYSKKIIAMAGESLDRHEKPLRDISSVTISVSHKDLEEIRLRAREFRSSLLAMKTGNTPSDVVYQVNVQIFPLTAIYKGGNNE